MAKKTEAVETYCGLTEKQVREYFFTRQIEEMVSEIQRKQMPEPEEFAKLFALLEKLESEDIEFKKKITEIVPVSKDAKPPTVAELMDERESSPEFATWQADRDKAVNWARNLMGRLSRDTLKTNINDRIHWKTYTDFAMQTVTLLPILAEDAVYKSQKYHAQITRIVDDFGCSRREAQDRAHLTNEYAEYKRATMLYETMQEFINICKKKSSENQ